jgi:hypothetical protein
MEEQTFENFLIDNEIPDNTKKLLRNIHNSLIILEMPWLTKNQSQTQIYLSNIKINFDLYGLPLFTKHREVFEIASGCYLFSQYIDARKIQIPRGIPQEAKTLYKQNISRLISSWTVIGGHFSYGDFVKKFINVNHIDDLTEQLSNKIKF